MTDRKLRTFYFNTGVKPWMNPYRKGMLEKDGTLQIPFQCHNVPDHAKFKFSCDDKELKEYNCIVRKIHNSTLVSKYAYFKLKDKESKP